MRFPRECYQIQHPLTEYLPALRPAQRQGLTLWVYGTVMAHSACQTAVIAALLRLGGQHAVRQYLREWLYGGADKAAPCKPQLDVTCCFAGLLRWVVSLWHGKQMALAVDVTYRRGDLTVLVVSVLYRGSAIPVAWRILRCNQPGAWIEPLCTLLKTLGPAVPSTYTVLVLADRGLRGLALWQTITALGWHPLIRQRSDMTFRPAGGRHRTPARERVSGAGHAWVGAGIAFKHARHRRACTLIVVWDVQAVQPWILLTDLPPQDVEVSWYGLRMWIELGFRALKGVGWQWQRTRRLDPERAARHWLVLSVATIWVLAVGSRVDDALALGRPPDRVRIVPATVPTRRSRRPHSVFALGRVWLPLLLHRGRLWTHLWLRPEPWPSPPPAMQIIRHCDTANTT